MIPLNVHQFWDSVDPPSEVKSLMVSWRALNPEWTYRLWSDGTIEDLIAKGFGPRVLEAFRDCKFPAMRADISRYLVLYQYGGVYADADLKCLKPLSCAIDLSSSMFVFRARIAAWRNDLMACTQGFPLMKRMIDQAVENVLSKSSQNLWAVTGPGMTTPLITESIEAGEAIQHLQFHEVRNLIVQFNNDLVYRSHGKHWAEAQKKESIYRSNG
jgi:mannosyltransferase OCH1-like enzyme